MTESSVSEEPIVPDNNQRRKAQMSSEVATLPATIAVSERTTVSASTNGSDFLTQVQVNLLFTLINFCLQVNSGIADEDLTNGSAESPLSDIIGSQHEDTLVQAHEVTPESRLNPPGFEEQERCGITDLY